MSLVPIAYARVDMGVFAKAIDPIVSNIINPVIGLLFVIGVVVFAYGIFEMIWKGGDPDARTVGRNHMIGGVIGMFIMLSAWGIINLIANTIGSI
jgi:uncharacterized membrane protein